MIMRSEITPYKQECLYDLAKTHINVCQNVFNKYKNWLNDRTYYVYDLMAGDMDPNYQTSPKTFLDICSESSLKCLLLFFEEKKDRYKKLVSNVSEWRAEKEASGCNLGHLQIKGMNEPMQNIQGKLKSKPHKYGIAYYDSMGYGGDEELDFLKWFLKIYPKVDIILNFSLLQIKMKRCNNPKSYRYPKKGLKGILNTLPKEHWWVRPPENEEDTLRWTMFFGTNNPNFTVPRYDFYKTTSLEGEHILNSYDSFVRGKKEDLWSL